MYEIEPHKRSPHDPLPVGPTVRSIEPFVGQRATELAFLPHRGAEVACLERVQLAQLDSQLSPTDNGYALARGILTAEMIRGQVRQFADSLTLSVNLESSFETALAANNRISIPPERAEELKTEVFGLVRNWQQRWPPDDDLDWIEARAVGFPRMQLVLRRPGGFQIPVRASLVLAVGDTLVSFELTTSRDPSAIPEARVALLHHALLRSVPFRHPDGSRYTNVAVRLEFLALGMGVTKRFDPDEAKAWQAAIGQVAENLARGQGGKNPGEWCGDCRYQIECFGASDDDQAF